MLQKNAIFHIGDVVSDGTTGVEWINRLSRKGFKVGDHAKSVLLSPKFIPTTGVTTKTAVIKGDSLDEDDRVTSVIRSIATDQNLFVLNAETACLLREKLSDQQLVQIGLQWVVVMHEPIKDENGDLNLLRVSRIDGGNLVNTCYGEPRCWWRSGSGFAFGVL